MFSCTFKMRMCEKWLNCNPDALRDLVSFSLALSSTFSSCFLPSHAVELPFDASGCKCRHLSTLGQAARVPGMNKKLTGARMKERDTSSSPCAPSQTLLVHGSKKKYLRQHSVLDWSPTSILSGPCDACLRGSDETRKVHRGMAADAERGCDSDYIPFCKLLFVLRSSAHCQTWVAEREAKSGVGGICCCVSIVPF